jgi:hypothetical protein
MRNFSKNENLLGLKFGRLTARIAYKVSYPLFLIASVYFLYHVADMLLFMYNYKQTGAIYFVLALVSTVSVILLLLTKYGKLKSVK